MSSASRARASTTRTAASAAGPSAWLLRWDRRRRLEIVPIGSEEGDRALGDLGEARLESWHLVRDGERRSGGRAFAPLLEELPGGRALAPLARRLEFVLVPLYAGWRVTAPGCRASCPTRASGAPTRSWRARAG